MKYSNVLVYILLVTSLIINLYYIYNTSHSSNVEQNNTLKERNFLRHKVGLEMNANDVQIDPDIKVISVKGDTTTLENIINKGTLILSSSFLQCGACINNEINNLEMIFGKNDDESIIILTKFDRFRNYIIFTRQLKKQFKCYMLAGHEVDINPLDTINSPYYFFVDKDHKATKCFLPEKAFNNQTLDYLKYIKEYFKEN